MKAGRELDKAVALDVMGWTEASGKDIELPCFWANNGEFSFQFTPSTNIADAWKVVEKAITFEVEKDCTAWSAVVGFKESEYLGIVYLEDTAPLAIVLAALKAFGYE